MESKMVTKIREGTQITYNDLDSLPPEVVVNEYICTGNSGRSPLAEAIANDYIFSKNIEERVVAISSGTQVDLLANLKPSFKHLVLVLERAAERNGELEVYSIEESYQITKWMEDRAKMEARYGVDQSLRESFHEQYERARVILIKEEHEFRSHAAQELGLTMPIKRGSQQTAVCERVTSLFAMAPSNEVDAQQIYGASDKNPRISNFGIENTFGLRYGDYIRMARGLGMEVRKSIDQSEGKLE